LSTTPTFPCCWYWRFWRHKCSSHHSFPELPFS
jgi:hypothetical protein